MHGAESRFTSISYQRERCLRGGKACPRALLGDATLRQDAPRRPGRRASPGVGGHFIQPPATAAKDDEAAALPSPRPHYIGRPRRGAEFMTLGVTRCWPTRPRSANERIPDGGERILRQRSDQKSFCRLRQSRRALFGGFPAKQEAPERHIHARSNAQARHDRPKLGMACVSVRQRSSTV